MPVSTQPEAVKTTPTTTVFEKKTKKPNICLL